MPCPTVTTDREEMYSVDSVMESVLGKVVHSRPELCELSLLWYAPVVFTGVLARSGQTG